MKTVSIQVPDETYEAYRKLADQCGRTLEGYLLDTLLKNGLKPRVEISEAEREEARQRFQRHIGAWDSGDPGSADNERIDADLAREYGSTHEEAG